MPHPLPLPSYRRSTSLAAPSSSPWAPQPERSRRSSRSPFKTQAGKTVRPDGLMGVSRAGRTWWALVESQDRRPGTEQDQMESYLDLAREVGNRCGLLHIQPLRVEVGGLPDCARSEEDAQGGHPSLVVGPRPDRSGGAEAASRRQGPGSGLHLGRAHPVSRPTPVRCGSVQLHGQELGPRSRWAHAFARSSKGRSQTSADVANRWDELLRFLSLDLTKDLGLDVRESLRRRESEGASRQQALRESLASKGQLYGVCRSRTRPVRSRSWRTCRRGRSSLQRKSMHPARVCHGDESAGSSGNSRRRLEDLTVEVRQSLHDTDLGWAATGHPHRFLVDLAGRDAEVRGFRSEPHARHGPEWVRRQELVH